MEHLLCGASTQTCYAIVQYCLEKLVGFAAAEQRLRMCGLSFCSSMYGCDALHSNQGWSHLMYGASCWRLSLSGIPAN